VELLKNACAEALGASLDLDSVVYRFELADMHNAPALKQKCIQFIAANKQEVLHSCKFKNMALAHPEVALQVYQEMATTSNAYNTVPSTSKRTLESQPKKTPSRKPAKTRRSHK